jgi:hypothetical protein
MNKEHTSGVLKNDKIPNKNKDENVKKDGEAKKDDNNSPTSQ